MLHLFYKDNISQSPSCNRFQNESKLKSVILNLPDTF